MTKQKVIKQSKKYCDVFSFSEEVQKWIDLIEERGYKIINVSYVTESETSGFFGGSSTSIERFAIIIYQNEGNKKQG